MAGEPDSAETEVLRRFLAERNVACPGCGYNLRGSNGAKCPECAGTVSLGNLVARPVPRWARPMAASCAVFAVGSLVNGGVLVRSFVGYGSVSDYVWVVDDVFLSLLNCYETFLEVLFVPVLAVCATVFAFQWRRTGSDRSLMRLVLSGTAIAAGYGLYMLALSVYRLLP